LNGFHNHDIEVPIEGPLPYADNSLEMVVASHVLEHADSAGALNFLTEVYRILKPDGIIRLTCPVIGQWLDINHARDLCRNHTHKIILNEYSMRDLLWMAGFSPSNVRRVDLDETYDTHWRVIGKELDAAESCRLVATK
jgi:predicted SAM-dependent methyltransferase